MLCDNNYKLCDDKLYDNNEKISIKIIKCNTCKIKMFISFRFIFRIFFEIGQIAQISSNLKIKLIHVLFTTLGFYNTRQ